MYMRRNPNCKVTFYEDEITKKILSENMTMQHWNRIIYKIKTIKWGSYDGVIITHGTDTLTYSAALFSVLLSHVRKPVILVSSNEPLTSSAANGYKNFEDAVNFIFKETGKYSGVFVTFSYDLQKTVVYQGSRITQSQPFIDRFESCDGVDFGVIENGNLTVNNADIARKCIGQTRRGKENILDKIDTPDNSVLLIHPYVGLDYSRFDLDKGNIKAVLHCTYHSFSMCVDDTVSEKPSKTSAEYLLKKCCKRNIPLYFASFENTCKPYESTYRMFKQGARFIVNESVESAYAKLLIGHNIQKKKGLLKKDLRRELELRLF
jgi:L-asparaginase